MNESVAENGERWNRMRENVDREEPLELKGLQRLIDSALARGARWLEIWQIYYDSPWFRNTLSAAAQRTARRAGMSNETIDDIQQEALIRFAKILARDPSFGFDINRGSYRSLINTIVNRCCLKSLQQFRHRQTENQSMDHLMAMAQDLDVVDDRLDAIETINRLPEPTRTVAQLYLNGQSIGEISEQLSRSQRTVYRQLEKAVDLIRSMLSRRIK